MAPRPPRARSRLAPAASRRRRRRRARARRPPQRRRPGAPRRGAAARVRWSARAPRTRSGRPPRSRPARTRAGRARARGRRSAPRPPRAWRRALGPARGQPRRGRASAKLLVAAEGVEHVELRRCRASACGARAGRRTRSARLPSSRRSATVAARPHTYARVRPSGHTRRARTSSSAPSGIRSSSSPVAGGRPGGSAKTPST